MCTTPCINRVIKFLSRCLRSATTTTSTTATTATTTITTTNNATAIRNELLDLVTNMRGEASELRRLEDSINALEATYVPCHTVTFLNHVMMPGTWQFRFSSRYLNRTTTSIRSPSFRLRDFYQHCVPTGVSRGNVTHTCRWEWNSHQQPQPQPQPQQQTNDFDCYGTFTIKGDYVITSNGRIVTCPSSQDDKEENEAPEVSLQPEMILELLPQSSVPQNVTLLMQYIQRAIRPELFDFGNNTGYDITYMDEAMKIVRYDSPAKYSGIRNIFRRVGATTTNAAKDDDNERSL